MTENPSHGKASRLIQIELLLLSHPEGLTQSEIARRLNVNRSTIFRNLTELNAPIYVENHRYYINRESYLVHVRFNLHEALALHMATRLLTTRSDRQNPHSASALRKLGTALEAIASPVGKHMQESAELLDSSGRTVDLVYLDCLEKLTLAWASLQKVRIGYLSHRSGQVRDFVLSVYYIEPYAVGQTSYVIAYSEPQMDLRTYKLERIRFVEHMDEGYSIPADFKLSKLMNDAWGIWGSEGEPVEVLLKFSPKVAERVKETRWHQSEELLEQDDHSLLWKARIAEPREMLNWIKGWGSEVEVLAPEKLRAEMALEALRLCEIYGAEVNDGE